MKTPMIVTLQLPHGRDWLWYRDLQILGLSADLDGPGREAAVDQFLAESRQTLVLQLDRPAI